MFKKFAPIFDENLSLEEKIRFFFREHISFLQKNPRLVSFVLYEMNRNPERVRKIIYGLDIDKLWNTLLAQHNEEFEKYGITRENIPSLAPLLPA
jgi:hypothetical protein